MAHEEKSVAATASRVESGETQDLPPDINPPYFPSYRRLMELPHNAHGAIMDPAERQKSFMTNVVAEFASAEHHWLGDGLSLMLEDGHAQYAMNVPFQLPNGLALTYGQINCLAGDFYATKNPICLGATAAERTERFHAAFDFLAQHNRTAPEATQILKLMQNEVTIVNDALRRGEDPSVVYAHLPPIGVAVEKLTLWRKTLPDGLYPTYLGVSRINLDHFGADAHVAWQAGHLAALQIAAAGELRRAYAMNAFADHFLEDSFAAGHMRTPRRLCQEGGISGDGCARFMHDEDNAIGLTISPHDPAAHPPWRAYGDRRLLDKADRLNSHYCQQALQLSANAIYHAFQTKHVPAPSSWDVWRYLPDLKVARGGEGVQVSVPLFTFGGERRLDVEDRRTWVFTREWGWKGTLVEVARSPRWKYPITLD